MLLQTYQQSLIVLLVEKLSVVQERIYPRKFVREMPFGVSGGGSSGFDSFPYSTYVTEDIDAGGEELHKQYYKENNSNFYRDFRKRYGVSPREYAKRRGGA